MRFPRTLLLVLVTTLGLLAPTSVVGGATAAGGAVAGAAPAAERPGTTAAPTRTFLTLNVAGKNGRNARGVDPVAGDLVRAVRRQEPYAATLNEICGKQAWAAARRLDRYRVVFFRVNSTCPGRTGFGNAVLIRNGPVRSKRVMLPIDEGARNLGCVSRRSPRIAVCTTHLVAARDRGAERRRQAAKVAQVTRGYVRDRYATFVGGDFNDTPTADTLDPMYRPGYGQGARGIYTESAGCCGRHGQPTLGGAKFDYGFFSWQWRRVGTRVTDAPYSDHDQVWTRLRRK